MVEQGRKYRDSGLLSNREPYAHPLSKSCKKYIYEMRYRGYASAVLWGGCRRRIRACPRRRIPVRFRVGAHADGNSVTLVVSVRVGGGHADAGAEGVHGIVSVRFGGGHRQWIQRFSRPVRRENGLHHAGDSPRGHHISCEARTRMRFRRILAEISPPTRSTGILFMVEDVCFASRCCHRSARLPHLLHGIRHSAGCRTTIRHGTLVHYVAARRCPHTPAHTQLHT